MADHNLQTRLNKNPVFQGVVESMSANHNHKTGSFASDNHINNKIENLEGRKGDLEREIGENENYQPPVNSSNQEFNNYDINNQRNSNNAGDKISHGDIANMIQKFSQVDSINAAINKIGATMPQEISANELHLYIGMILQAVKEADKEVDQRDLENNQEYDDRRQRNIEAYENRGYDEKKDEEFTTEKDLGKEEKNLEKKQSEDPDENEEFEKPKNKEKHNEKEPSIEELLIKLKELSAAVVKLEDKLEISKEQKKEKETKAEKDSEKAPENYQKIIEQSNIAECMKHNQQSRGEGSNTTTPQAPTTVMSQGMGL
jgi:hypothetical protein